MNKNNIFLTFIILALVYGCASVEPKYLEGEPTENFGYPTDLKVEKSFYLLGDGGYSPPGGTSLGLIALKNYIDSLKVNDNYTVFLGDNIYPVGMPEKDSPNREEAEYRIDAQLDAIEEYQGNVLFIPGNHDWYNNGLKGLEREKEYIDEQMEEEVFWAPEIGCGLQSIEISDNIQMIVIDSQWYLEDWDDHPTINDNCPEIKTREAMFLELESELDKNQNKSVIVALHHPLYTNGIHGGQYEFIKHIYPSQKNIPVPILGSMVALVRTTGGISIQDAQNERYKSLVRRIETIAKDAQNVVFISGHEHSLQYIKNGNIKQIVSGSGSKASYAVLSNDGLFVYNGQGFAVYDVFENGSSWVSFYGNKDNKAELLYRTEVLSAPEEFDLSKLPEEFPQTMVTSVYEKEETEKTEIYKSIWGDRYRDLYGKPIEVDIVELDTLYGGLKAVRKGGGHQTKTVRLEDSLGRDYNMRRIKKSATQFLQTVAYKDTPVEESLENTLAADVIEDFYTAAHPYAFLAVPKLSEAVNIYHTNPELFYVPKQKTLGKYNSEYGDELYMIEERPEEDYVGYESFGSPNHDIESTAGMFERVRRDEKYSVDETAYVRARVFDMLIGDWDRHQDQWRWGEVEDEEGNRIFEPIPRDRDQAFSNFDGAFFGTLRGLTGIANQFAVYSPDIKDVKWFNTAASGLDRTIIQNVGRETWIEQAKYIQENITDKVIEEAFAELPEETRGEITSNIIESLKGRRKNIVEIAKRYYDYIAELAIITATDKDDLIEVKRLPEGKTQVIVSRLKDGEKADLVSDKTYLREETKEIWIYGLDDDDIFEVEGDEKKKLIFIRIIGGQNNDIYKVAENSGGKIKIYDHESKPNTIESKGEAKIRFRDDYETNTFDKDKRIFNSSNLVPAFGYNPDDGFKLGVKGIYTENGFKRNPFTARHTVTAGYYFGTQGLDLSYRGEFANIINDFNLSIGAYYSSPKSVLNFFGFGNETPNFEDELSKDYNRTRISRIGVDAGFVNKTPFGSYFAYNGSFEGVRVEATEDRFITEGFVPENTDFFERKYFAGLEGIYRYESYDYVLNPTRGMKFELVLGGKVNTKETDRNFGYFKPYLGFFNSLTRNRKLVLNSRVQAHLNIGDDYEFYQAAFLGGNTGLRGYRLDRFAGKTAFSTGGDLRYSFDQFKTNFLPFQIGIFTGYDVGRVWQENDDSSVWHDSYGGGFWVNSAEALNATFNLFAGGEGLRFSFGLGFNF